MDNQEIAVYPKLVRLGQGENPQNQPLGRPPYCEGCLKAPVEVKPWIEYVPDIHTIFEITRWYCHSCWDVKEEIRLESEFLANVAKHPRFASLQLASRPQRSFGSPHPPLTLTLPEKKRS